MTPAAPADEPGPDPSGPGVLATLRFPQPLMAHQQRALAACEAASDRTRAHLVLPPGAGKTLIGAELARRAGRPLLVLVPNTAIAGQWVALLRSATGPGAPLEVGEDRSLDCPATVLTYQAVATFAPDAEGAEPAAAGVRRGGQLHPEAARMLDRLAQGPPITVVLDEAHHLAETWGEVLDEVITRIGEHAPDRAPLVIALTATPRSRLTPDQAELTDRLFGPVLFTGSTPALVRDGVLAPFRELAWFVEPTAAESDYLASSATHWLELTTGLLDPGFASTGFLEFIDATWVRRETATATVPGSDAADTWRPGTPVVPWTSVERAHPDLARAVCRLHAGAGLVGLPVGARLREEHRTPPDAQDWAVLIADYARRVLADSPDPRDARAWERLRTGMRAVGWTLTRRGARRGQSAVDRLLARSAAKADAAVTIIGHEWAQRGTALTALVVTDFATASPTPVAELERVLDQQSGSAWEALVQLVRAHPQCHPLLVTGNDIAGRREDMQAMREALPRGESLALGLAPVGAEAGIVTLSGPGWTPRAWVPRATQWLESGRSNVLVGTRGLLGEGWDAARLNVLVDLTAATTSTAVVQVRGRAIRRDPGGPKAAHIWSVVAVADSHPRGDTDYRRFLAKHDGFHAADAQGRITTGVGHVSPLLSPFAAPSADQRSALNSGMLTAGVDPAELAALWGVGQPYEGVDSAVVVVQSRRRAAGPAGPRPAAPATRPHAWVPAAGAALGAGLPVAAGSGLPLSALLGLVAGGALGLGADTAAQGWALHRHLHADPGGLLLAIARAVAQGVPGLPAGLGVTTQPEGSGVWRLGLDGAEARTDALFAESLAQALAPLDWPRYLISRRVPGTRAEIWHAVPDAAGTRRDTAQLFAQAWRHHVSRGRLVYCGTPEGAGLLAAARGADPLDITAAIRTQWR